MQINTVLKQPRLTLLLLHKITTNMSVINLAISETKSYVCGQLVLIQ